MKKFVWVISITVILFSCNKDEEKTYPNYWKSLGVFESTGSGDTEYIINLDNGNVIVPKESNVYTDYYNTGDRVKVLYSIYSEQETDTNKNYSAVVHDLRSVLTKDVITLTDDIADSINNDPIHVHEEDIWFSKNYLNIYFNYYGYQETHYINLIKFPNDSVDADGNLVLEFRHNGNNDYMTYVYDGIVSFDMNSLYQPSLDSLPIVVKVNDYDGDSLIWKGTYYFTEQEKSAKSVDISSKKALFK